MALRIFDRVKQVTSSTGTGNITLGGTPTGFQSFSDVFSSGDTTYICIENGANWEVSRATYGVAGSGTLSRDAVLDSSTGAAINLSGRSTVFCTVPAAKYAYLDPSGEINLSLGGLSDTTITSPATGNILSYNGSQWVNATPAPGYSDEQAQDAIGGILGSGADIVLSYNDATPAITGSLTNTTVTPGSYTLASITVDQKGRVTAASSGSVDLSAYLTSATAASTYVALGGSYSNPTWITGLAWSKLSGLPSAVSNLSGTNTGDQDLSSYATTAAVAAAYLPLAGGILTSPSAASVPLSIVGAASQSAFLLDLKDSSNASVLGVSIASSNPKVVFVANPSYSVEVSLYGYAWYFTGAGGANYAGFQTVYGPNQLSLASTTSLSWSSGTNARNAGDLHLVRDAAGTLAQRDGTNAQVLRIYNTYSSSTSGEYAELRWVSNVLYMGSNKGSAGGSARDIAITHGGTVVANFLSDRLYLGPITDGTSTGGNARGQYAVDLQMLRGAASQVASGSYTVVIGTYNTASGSYSRAIGHANTASGGTCLAIGHSCTASADDTVAIGSSSTASGANAVAIGNSNTASANGACAIGGYQNTASAIGATAIGWQTVASEQHSRATGLRSGATRYGQTAHAAGFFAATGDAQYVLFILRNKTTNNTPTTLFLDGSSTRLTIPSGKTMSCKVTVKGIKSDGSAKARFVRLVEITNVGGTTALDMSPEALGTDYNPSGCDCDITEDDTNDALQINVTGITGETWRWVAVVEGLEIAYGV